MVSIRALSLYTILIWITFTTIRSQYVYKCVEEKNNNYVCDANWGEFNITEEFRYLSSNLPANGKVLNRLEIHHTNITEIPKNFLSDLSFTYIEFFETQNLTRIHSEAFGSNAVAGMKTQLFIAGPSKLRDFGSDYSLYKALSSLVNTADIELNLETGYYLHEIPDNAFNVSQNSLKWLAYDYNDYNISRIGNYAFSGLSALQAIGLRGIPVGKISSHSFDFSTPSDQMLNINLENCRITDDAIEDGGFSEVKRPLTLNLDSNQIQYISEAKFSNFFKSNPQNILQLYGNALNCADVTPYVWLLQNTQYKNQTEGAVCSNSTPIWNLDITGVTTTIPPTLSPNSSVAVFDSKMTAFCLLIALIMVLLK